MRVAVDSLPRVSPDGICLKLISVRSLVEHMFVDVSDGRRIPLGEALSTLGSERLRDRADHERVPRHGAALAAPGPAPGDRNARSSCQRWADSKRAHCYLLGCYLGDCHITHRPPNGWTLRLACDQRYEAIIAEILAAMARTFPGSHPTRYGSSSGASDVLAMSHRAIGRAFPQHGPGRKHLRPIELTDWQLARTHAQPGALIRVD